MSTRSRLARLETRVQDLPTVVRQSAEDIGRAEVARQRLPECTDPEEALSLIRGLPGEVYSRLLRLVPETLLIAMHDTAFQSYQGRELNYGYTWEELRALPASELMSLHWENIRHVEKPQGRYR